MPSAMRFKRHEAASYLQQGFSSRLLAPKIGISQRTAVNWASEFREKGKTGFLAGPSYRPMPHHRLTKRDVHKVVSHFKNNAHRDDFSTRVAARELKAQKGVDVSYRWAGTLAHRAGLPARLRTHKPQTKPEQRQKRVFFAKGWSRPRARWCSRTSSALRWTDKLMFATGFGARETSLFLQLARANTLRCSTSSPLSLARAPFRCSSTKEH